MNHRLTITIDSYGAGTLITTKTAAVCKRLEELDITHVLARAKGDHATAMANHQNLHPVDHQAMIDFPDDVC